MVTWLWVNIGTKPLTEPMLTSPQWGTVVPTRGQFHLVSLNFIILYVEFEKKMILLKSLSRLPGTNGLYWLMGTEAPNDKTHMKTILQQVSIHIYCHFTFRKLLL